MASPDKAKMVEIKTANRIKNLKGTGSSASAKASKADLESKGRVYTSKDVTKGAKAVEARRKIDLGKTLARAKAKTRFKEEVKSNAAPKPKTPTYGELSNIRTKLEMQQKNLKSKFPNDSVKVTHTMSDGKKITLSDVNKQLNKMNPKPKSIKDVAVPVKAATSLTEKKKK